MSRRRRSSAVEARTRRSTTREAATRPERRISSVNERIRLAVRLARAGATNVPRPGTRYTRPSWTSRCTAPRAVMRETPNSSQSWASDGIGACGSSAATRPRSDCSIVTYRGTGSAMRVRGPRIGIVQRDAVETRLDQRQMPPAEVRGDQLVAPLAGEHDVRRRGRAACPAGPRRASRRLRRRRRGRPGPAGSRRRRCHPRR